MQIIGLKHYDDIQVPISREEVAEIGRLVGEAAAALFPGCEVEIMGSYRRGAPSSHDVDCLITNTRFNDTIPKNCVADVIRKLANEKTLVDHPAWLMNSDKKAAQYKGELFYHDDEQQFDYDDPADERENLEEINKAKANQSYMGVARVASMSGLCRLVDIKWYPYKQRAFAQLYFTGNAYFNRSMRLYSKIIGHSLSDRGLIKTQRKYIGGKYQVLAKKTSLPATTEADMFRLMGLEYRAPNERNTYDVVATAVLGTPKGEAKIA